MWPSGSTMVFLLLFCSLYPIAHIPSRCEDKYVCERSSLLCVSLIVQGQLNFSTEVTVQCPFSPGDSALQHVMLRNSRSPSGLLLSEASKCSPTVLDKLFLTVLALGLCWWHWKLKYYSEWDAACDAAEEKLPGRAIGARFHVFSLFFTACSSKDEGGVVVGGGG